MSKFAGLVAGWRALSPGRGASVYWGGVVLLVVLGTVPFILFSLTAPSAEVDRPLQLNGSSRSLDGEAPAAGDEATPSATPTAGGPGSATTPTAPVVSSTPGGSRAARGTGSDADNNGSVLADGDFAVQCWPETTVIPGRSATVDCRVELTNGYDGEISVGCRLDGMACSVNPPRIRAAAGQTSVAVRLMVEAPASAPVGTKVASVTATGGETGAAQRQADVNVNVPPPFSVSCESVGTSFVEGAKAQVKCWVTFHEGFGGNVSLRLLNGAALDASLDTSVLPPAPNETRAFVIEFDTAGLASRPYTLQVDAASDRYREQATALFQIIPAL